MCSTLMDGESAGKVILSKTRRGINSKTPMPTRPNPQLNVLEFRKTEFQKRIEKRRSVAGHMKDSMAQ